MGPPGAELQGQMAGERFCGQGRRAASSCTMTEWPEKSKYLERHTAGAHARYLAQVVCCRESRAERKRPAKLVVSGGRQLRYDGMVREVEVFGKAHRRGS